MKKFSDQELAKGPPMATWYVALSPMFTLLLFGATALHVRRVFGSWPDNAVDHAPTILPALNISVFKWATLFGLFLAGPVWVTLLFYPPARRNFCSHLLQGVSLAIGVIALFWVPLIVDPKYVTWWLD